MKKIKTLGEFIIDNQQEISYATGELTSLLSSIKLAAKIVHREINKAGLLDLSSINQNQNIHGEIQNNLDIFANETFKDTLKARNQVCGIVSEEEDNVVTFDKQLNVESKYVVLMDPLDGSSNIDVNVSVGSIFSIFKRKTPVGCPVEIEDFLQPGTKQVAAGYIIYGSSTMLVYTTGNGVHGFTYDPSLGVFALSHENIKIPTQGKIYSINEGNYTKFPQGIKSYIKYCQEIDKETSRPFTSRYIGSLVADFHRNLLKGGIFLYPSTATYPNGKLRLLYECNPIAFIAEQAGGLAISNNKNILEITPEEIHQRVPFFVGSKNMISHLKKYIF